MTTNPPILKNSALVLPFAVAVGALWGIDFAIAAAASGLLALANLWVLSVLGPRLVTAIAREEFSALWVAALVAKFILLAALLVGMVQFLPPLGIALGFVPLLVGTLITAVQLAQADNELAQQENAAHGEA